VSHEPDAFDLDGRNEIPVHFGNLRIRDCSEEQTCGLVSVPLMDAFEAHRIITSM
jgi:hypothetical protein